MDTVDTKRKIELIAKGHFGHGETPDLSNLGFCLQNFIVKLQAGEKLNSVELGAMETIAGILIGEGMKVQNVLTKMKKPRW